MERVAILTDSNSGITQEEGKKLGIRVVPMPFTIDGEEYLEDINLTQEEFYKKLEGDAQVSTSQPSIAYVATIWDELLEEYDSVVYIPMSSGLSKSCETATQYAEANYNGKVFVVNNQRISVTQRQSVLDAIELASKGYTGKEIHDILIEVKFQSVIYIMVDTLTYLKKGGRITPTAAALGGMLKLKPVLIIEGEKLDKYRMRNRSLDNAEKIMIDAIEKDVNGFLKDLDGRTDNVNYAIAYTGTDTTDAMGFKAMVKEHFGITDIVVNPLSLSVSCHIGPGAVALAVSKKLPDKYTNK